MESKCHQSGSFRDLKALLAECDSHGGSGSSRSGDELPYEVRNRTHMLCSLFLGGAWKAVEVEDLRLSRMKGGMSNMLFLCELPEGVHPIKNEPGKTLLRVYFNPETETHLVAESVIFTLLSERQLGPRLYGIFNGGRLEEYIVSRALTCAEIRDPAISAIIAKKFYKIHQLEVPIGKEPDYLCEALERWVEHLSAICEVSPYPLTLRYADGKTITVQEEDIEKEIDLIRRCMCRSKSPVLFCHNDLQEGNILLHDVICSESNSAAQNGPTNASGKVKRDLVFIDFEYASYNYRGFDFANHFCEWALDYTSDRPPYFTVNWADYPTAEEQKKYFRAYLANENLTESEREKTVDILVEETAPFIPVSHFFWGVWALLQVELSPVEFGFAEYGRERLSLYFQTKPNMLRLLGDDTMSEPIVRFTPSPVPSDGPLMIKKPSGGASPQLQDKQFLTVR